MQGKVRQPNVEANPQSDFVCNQYASNCHARIRFLSHLKLCNMTNLYLLSCCTEECLLVSCTGVIVKLLWHTVASINYATVITVKFIENGIGFELH